MNRFVKMNVGRNQVSKEVRALILHMIAQNPTWGAPRIHGELVNLGFDLSERSVSRWGSAISERSRSLEAMADVPQES